jgi:arginine/lysine/ornithine decarboxylase
LSTQCALSFAGCAAIGSGCHTSNHQESFICFFTAVMARRKLSASSIVSCTSVLCDRNCHKSILHSLIMTGATPIYLVPSRNGLGIIGPISPEQFTPESIRQKVAATSPR